MYIGTCRVVCLAVLDHQPEIGLKGISVVVQPFFQLRVHSAEIHWRLNDIEVCRGLVSDRINWLLEEHSMLVCFEFLQSIATRLEIVSTHAT